MPKWFGTDGLRGKAGQFPLDQSTVFKLGQALVHLLEDNYLKPVIIIGRDTRESGSWLEAALGRGIVSAGGEVNSAGVITTSAIAYLTREEKFSAGVVISASHNPFEDNGIKIFQTQGTKIPEEWEDYLEEKMMSLLSSPSPSASPSVSSGKENFSPKPENYYQDKYLAFLEASFAGCARDLKVVVDCAHGASVAYAPLVLSSLGFKVISMGCSPNGRNINFHCGSLYPQSLAQKVVNQQADLGIAYDGDADRAIWVDHQGRILNGDHTLFILARYFQKKKLLSSDKIVGTIMSNLGLEMALSKLNLKLVRAKVGDKYVLEAMLSEGSNLGGERSGHTIILDKCPTGDGILTSLKILEVMSNENASLSQLVSDYSEFPQRLINIPVKKKLDLNSLPEVQSILEEAQQALEGRGRLFIRYSGTEPLLRLLLESEEESLIELWGKRLQAVLKKVLN
ncbi:MAG TPA: phosphoglucosamine mutase [Candidatus Aminicenantes bacterium]|nr:phosphoglucosamine mutase [Candidatus Aminicenantes bacterium]